MIGLGSSLLPSREASENWYTEENNSGPHVFVPNQFSKAGFAGGAAKTLLFPARK